MSKEFLDCQQIRAIFIKMGAKSMSKGMTGEFGVPMESFAVLHKFIGKTGRTIGSIFFTVRREKPVGGSAALEPIGSKQL